MRLLHYGWHQGDVLHAVVPSRVREVFFGPRTAQYLDALFQSAGARFSIDAVAGEFIRSVALAPPEIEASVGDDVDRRRIFGNPDGIVQGQEHQVGAHPDASRSCGDCGRDRKNRGRVAVFGEVVLSEPRLVVAEFLGASDLRELLGVELRPWPPPFNWVAEREQQSDIQLVAKAHLPFTIPPP